MKGVLASAALLTAGCAFDQAELKVRAVPDPLTKTMRPGSPMIAEARGLLAMGNIGLAIEAYRKAIREQPGNVEALAGLAECYDEMGRHDLSQAKYEEALAIAPTDPVLLEKFAASLERQGRIPEGNVLRLEARAAKSASAAAALKPVAVAGEPPAQPRPRQSVAEAAPKPAPATRGGTQWTIQVPQQAPAPASVKAELPPPRSAPGVKATVESAGIATVTVKLPRPADAAPKTAKSAAGRSPTADRPLMQRPRLERLSLGEVALVTAPQPLWRAELVHRTALSTTVRFVPLASVQRDSGIRLLNAARHQGLAARTRLVLQRKGWNRVTVGDAERVREKSIILYSDVTAQAARRLASQLNFLIAKDARPGRLTILLGRDAVGRDKGRG